MLPPSCLDKKSLVHRNAAAGSGNGTTSGSTIGSGAGSGNGKQPGGGREGARVEY